MEPCLTRRDLICSSALLVTGGCLCHQVKREPAPQSDCCSTPELEPRSLTVSETTAVIELAKATSLGVVGAAARLVHAERSLDIMVIRTDRDAYIALGGKCTHAGRPLSFVQSRNVLQCNNFGHAIFDLDGQVLKGPAEQPLKVYPVTLTDGQLIITL
jgi:Rieske Fe-S protein